MKCKNKRNVIIAYILLFVLSATFYLLLVKEPPLEGDYVMWIFIFLGVSNVLVFEYLLWKSQLMRNFIKSIFGIV